MGGITRREALGGALGLTLSGGGCRAARSPSELLARDPLARELADWLGEDYRPFVVSNDARAILRKMPTKDGWARIEVVRLDDGRVVAAREDRWQLLLRFRPDDRALVYVVDEGERRFTARLWHLDSGEVERLPLPATAMADRMMRWSPAGNALTYFAKAPKGAGHRSHLGLWTRPHGPRVLAELGDVADFDFSPAGDSVAFAPSDEPGVVRVVRLDGALVRSVPVFDEFVRDLAWSLRGDLLVTGRDRADEFASMRSVAVATGRVSGLLARRDGDVRYPTAVAADAVLFQREVDSQMRVMLCRAGACHDVGPQGGDVYLRRVAPDRTFAIVDHLGLDRPRLLRRISLDGAGDEILRLGADPQPPTQAVLPRSLTLRAPGGSPFPAFLWAPSGAVRSVLIEAHGGRPHAQIRPHYAGLTQFLVSRGHAVLFPNFRGSTGYGRTFEAASESDKLADMEAVLTFARDELRVPASRTVLHGVSEGALLAAKVARAAADRIGALVLVSMLPGLPRVAGRVGRFRITAIHGALDQQLDLAGARRVLRDGLGETFSSAGNVFLALPGEGHNPRSREARALIGAALARALEAQGSEIAA